LFNFHSLEKIDELSKKEQTMREQYSKYKIHVDGELGMFYSNCILFILMHS